MKNSGMPRERTKRKLQDIEAAIAEIEKVRARLNSLSAVAKVLHQFPGFESIDRTTLQRFLAHDPKSTSQPKPRIETRIVEAARLLKQAQRGEETVRVAVLEGASEFAPVLLFEKHPEWAMAQSVRVTLVACHDRGELMRSVEDGMADLAVAPGHGEQLEEDFAEPGLAEPSRRRARSFCDFSTIPVSGLLMLGEDRRDEAVLEALRQLRMQNLGLGFLPHRGYRNAVQNYMRRSQAECPRFVMVTDHNDALQRFRLGEIRGVIGHKTFVRNCEAALEPHRQLKGIGSLRQISTLLFPPVVMQVFVPPEEKWGTANGPTRALLKKAIQVVYCAVKAVGNARIDWQGRQGLAQQLAEKLHLEKEEADNILLEYPFELKNFNSELLFKLW